MGTIHRGFDNEDEFCDFVVQAAGTVEDVFWALINDRTKGDFCDSTLVLTIAVSVLLNIFDYTMNEGTDRAAQEDIADTMRDAIATIQKFVEVRLAKMAPLDASDLPALNAEDDDDGYE